MLGKTGLRWLIALAGAATLIGAQSARAAVVIYSDADAFQVVAGPVKAFSGDGQFAHGLGVNLGSIVTPEALFRDAMASGSGVIDFHFIAGTTAFGGAFDRLPGSNFSNNLKVTLVFADGSRQVLDPVQYRRDGFFGFTSDQAFTDVLIENIGGPGGGGGGGGGGGASVDFGGFSGGAAAGAGPNMATDVVVVGVQSAADDLIVTLAQPVPEATTWAMMIGGIFGAGAMLRRTRGRLPA